MTCDILIRGATIVDGSGGEPFVGDVAIVADRIVSVGPAWSGQAASVIDAAGLVVTPGFVDIHTHYDGQAIWSQEMSPSSSHGVTTVVLGNCGVGFAPCRRADHDMLIRVMEGVEDIPGVVMAEGLPWDWETFPEYLDALASRPRDIDVAAFLPHSPLRVYAMGERGARREPANADDLRHMRDIAREAIDAGALGFASSRLMIHRTLAGEQIPSYDADRAEIDAIADALADAGRGALQIVLDVPFRPWRDELEPAIAIAERTGRPLTFTLGLPNAGDRNWEDALDLCDAARARGLAVSPQVLPRPVGMISGWELSTHPFCLCPSYLAIAGLPFDQRIEHLRDPAFREKLLTEPPQEGHPLAMMTRNWDWMFPLGDPPDYEPSPDSSIAAIARRCGQSPEAIAYDALMDGGDGHGMVLNALGNLYDGRLDAMLEIMRRPDAVLGLGDGGAHYGAICDASYTTHVLTHWVRDRKGERLTLPEAIRALSARPAETVGLRDRGRLAPGYRADVNVIDTDRLHLYRPHIRYDLPGGGRRLDQQASGYVATLCAGIPIRRGDEATGARPGRLVRGEQHPPA